MNMWTEEKVSQLIDLYKVFPELWDTKNKEYKNRNKKNEALRTISEVMGIEIIEIERKINVLLAQYRKNRNKVFSLMERGIDESVIQSIIWYGYKQMSFLEDRFGMPTRTQEAQVENKAQEEIAGLNDTDNTTGQNLEDTDNLTTDYLEDKLQVCITEVNDNAKPSISREDIRQQLLRRRIQKRRQAKMRVRCCHLAETLDLMKYLIGSREEAARDEYSLYGEQIACKLRKFDERTRLLTQHRINNVLHEIEMSNLQ